MKVKNVGVVVCGTMGSGIAQVIAQARYQVLVLEKTEDLLKKGLSSIESFLNKGIERGKIYPEER